MFRYLHYGLAAMLGFVGLKMIGVVLAEGQGMEPIPAVGVARRRYVC